MCIKKNSASFILLIAVAIIILAGVYCLALGSVWFSRSSRSDTMANIADTTAKWKTYSTLGFSMKYPASWGDPKVDNWAKGSSVSFLNDAFYVGDTAYIDPATGKYFTADNIGQQTLKTLSTQKDVTDLHQDKISLDGVNSTKISYVVSGMPLSGTLPGAPAVTQEIIRIFLPGQSGDVFEITYKFPLSDKKSQLTLFDNVISNFKFTGVKQPAIGESLNWQSYRNDKYNINLKYSNIVWASVNDIDIYPLSKETNFKTLLALAKKSPRNGQQCLNSNSQRMVPCDSMEGTESIILAIANKPISQVKLSIPDYALSGNETVCNLPDSQNNLGKKSTICAFAGFEGDEDVEYFYQLGDNTLVVNWRYYDADKDVYNLARKNFLDVMNSLKFTN